MEYFSDDVMMFDFVIMDMVNQMHENLLGNIIFSS